MVDDQKQSDQASQDSSSSQSSSPPTLPSDTSVISEEQSAGLDTNRPYPTVSADSIQIPADSSQTPSQSEEPISFTPTEASGTISAQSPQISADSSTPSIPPLPIESVSAESPPSPPEPITISSQSSPNSPNQSNLTNPPSDQTSPLSTPAIFPDVSTPSDLSLPAGEAGNPLPINVSPLDNQVPQVQSEASNDASGISSEKSENQSAEIKPESSEQPTKPSTPPENTVSRAQTFSFGDLLTSTSNISPPSSPVSRTDQSPLPPSQSSSSVAPQLDQSDQLVQEPKVIEKIVEVPVVNQEEVTKQIEERLKERLTILQQKGNQKKAAKKQTILQKIIDLTRAKGRINNQQAQKVFHLPQSTLTDYFQELVSSSSLKKEGKGKATYYHL